MKPKSVVTCLPTRDLEMSLAFYRDCFGIDDLQIEDGMMVIELGNLSLFVMSHDAFEQYTRQIGVVADYPWEAAQTLHSCAIADIAVFDHVFATAFECGGSVAKPPGKNAWGQHMGYVRDPDGHIWELVLVQAE